jgi:hypothetical protein
MRSRVFTTTEMQHFFSSADDGGVTGGQADGKAIAFFAEDPL